jgi:hypothetical protein
VGLCNIRREKHIKGGGVLKQGEGKLFSNKGRVNKDIGYSTSLHFNSMKSKMNLKKPPRPHTMIKSLKKQNYKRKIDTEPPSLSQLNRSIHIESSERKHNYFTNSYHEFLQ